MKALYEIDKEVGGDGAKIKGAVGVEADQLQIQLSASYPIVKIVEPATKAVDSLLDKLEKAIPGDWDKPMIEKFKVEYKEDLVKLLSE